MNERVRDGNLRAGFATVANFGPLRLTAGSAGSRDDSATLCSGDSGGAAYRVNGSTAQAPRLIVAVNSANLISRHISYLSRTSAPVFIKFFQEWRRKYADAKVCGLDAEIEPRCRTGK